MSRIFHSNYFWWTLIYHYVVGFVEGTFTVDGVGNEVVGDVGYVAGMGGRISDENWRELRWKGRKKLEKEDRKMEGDKMEEGKMEQGRKGRKMKAGEK